MFVDRFVDQGIWPRRAEGNDAVRALDDAPFLNWLDPAVQADPEPVYAELRTRTAVARTPLGATVLRRDDVHSSCPTPVW